MAFTTSSLEDAADSKESAAQVMGLAIGTARILRHQLIHTFQTTASTEGGVTTSENALNYIFYRGFSVCPESLVRVMTETRARLGYTSPPESFFQYHAGKIIDGYRVLFKLYGKGLLQLTLDELATLEKHPVMRNETYSKMIFAAKAALTVPEFCQVSFPEDLYSQLGLEARNLSGLLVRSIMDLANVDWSDIDNAEIEYILGWIISEGFVQLEKYLREESDLFTASQVKEIMEIQEALDAMCQLYRPYNDLSLVSTQSLVNAVMYVKKHFPDHFTKHKALFMQMHDRLALLDQSAQADQAGELLAEGTSTPPLAQAAAVVGFHRRSASDPNIKLAAASVQRPDTELPAVVQPSSMGPHGYGSA